MISISARELNLDTVSSCSIRKEGVGPIGKIELRDGVMRAAETVQKNMEKINSNKYEEVKEVDLSFTLAERFSPTKGGFGGIP